MLVVGSGASGGWVCKRLAEAGLKVALVDAGRPRTDQDNREHLRPFELKYRDRAPETIRKTRPIQQQCYACTEYNYDWFCSDLEEPYTTPTDKPFSWLGRMRIAGGRTNVWGRSCLRLSDLDFKAASHDGFGDDWPLSYRDLEPYYDLVEEYVGVTGMPEGVYELPDGKFQPPMGLTCHEVLFRSRVKDKLGWTATLAPSANLTRPTNGRAPCHYCGPCERGCVTRSYFNSAFTTVPDALKTGRCTYIPSAMVYMVLMDTDRNRASGVLYIDRNTRQPKALFGRAVVLCAQAQESVRILFNSANSQYPNGLANSSGVLGHYLMAHTMAGGGSGELPSLGAKPILNGPNRPINLYVIRFRNTLNGPRSKKFLRGYALQVGVGVDFKMAAPGFGGAYKKALFESPAGISLSGLGECLPRWENRVEIDPDVVDAYGIPVLNIHMADGQNEVAMLQDMADAAGEALEAVGAKNIRTVAGPSAPRWAIHEVGIARMG
ncbi:MAG TPA: GMC family oxidoreductase, partial [Steroidobacteraceae bacterium]